MVKEDQIVIILKICIFQQYTFVLLEQQVSRKTPDLEKAFKGTHNTHMLTPQPVTDGPITTFCSSHLDIFSTFIEDLLHSKPTHLNTLGAVFQLGFFAQRCKLTPRLCTGVFLSPLRRH